MPPHRSRAGGRRRAWPRLLLLILLVGCVGTEEGDGQVADITISEGEARVEALVLESMAVVRPDDRQFDSELLIGPSDCGRDDLVFSTISRRWDDVPLQEAIAGLDAVGQLWEQRGFTMDYSRRDRPDGQEILARTPDRDSLIAIVSAPDEGGIARFGVRADTACLQPSPQQEAPR